LNLFDVKNKKVMITGASRGLGKSIAEGFLKEGCTVVLLSRSSKTEQQILEYRERNWKAFYVECDLSVRDERSSAFDDAIKLLDGELDVLINCAGIQIRHPAEEFPISDFDKVLELNLTATYDLCQRAANVMLKKGYGKIINFASMNSYFGGYTISAYAASKGAIAQITKAFSNEWAGKGINVNAIAPGYMSTEMNINLINDESRYKEISDRIPAHRWGTGEDCVGPCIFLASKASDYLDGAIIPVDGGYLNK